MGANYTSSSYCTEESSTNSVTNMFTLKMYPALGTLNIHNFMHCIIPRAYRPPKAGEGM